MNKAPDALWNDCLKLIRDNVTEQQFDTWFKPIVFESFNTATKTLLVQVPSPFVYEYLEENYVDLLSKVLKRIYGASVQLSYRIVTDKYLAEVLEGLLGEGAGSDPDKTHVEPGVVVNVNFPDCRVEECKGIKWNCSVYMGDAFVDLYDAVEKLPEGGTRYKIRWVERDHATEGTDMHALMNGYISIGVVNNIS